MDARRVFELLQRGCALEVSLVQLDEYHSSYKFSLFFVSPHNLGESLEKQSGYVPDHTVYKRYGATLLARLKLKEQ